METRIDNRAEHSKDNEISLKELFIKIQIALNYLVLNWKIILFAFIFGGLLGFLYSYLKKPIYSAECTFVLDEQGNGAGIGQYAGIASIVGFDIAGSGSGLFQEDNIIELYKSRLMIQATLLSHGDFDGKRDLLINRYIHEKKLRKAWHKNPNLKNLSFNITKNRFSIRHDSIIGVIVNDINRNCLSVSRLDKKLSILSVKVKSEDELFAKVFTDKIVERVNDFYIKTRTKKARENYQILQKQADSIKAVLNQSIGNAAKAVDANPNANAALQILRVPSQRRQIDVQANSAIYAEIVKNLEVSKVSLRQEAPLIQIIDTPILPLEKSTQRKSIGALLGSIIASLIAVFFLVARKTIFT